MTFVAPNVLEVVNVAGVVVTAVKLVGVSPSPYSTCQVVLRPTELSSDCNWKLNWKLDLPVVLFSNTTKALPGSYPVELVCRIPNARFVAAACAVASAVAVSPVAEAKFLAPALVLLQTVGAQPPNAVISPVPIVLAVDPIFA
jgi:hypothetical protein